MTIRTPEGIVFPLRIAGPVSRFLALAIDQVVVYLAVGVMSLLLGVVGLLNMDVAGAFMILASFVLTLGYPIFLEWVWRGQTIGKRVLHLQVMDEQGLRLQFSQVLIRNLLRAVDALPAFYLVGGLAAFVGVRGQRLGDMAANTIVVQHPDLAQPDLDQVLPGKYNSFRDHPHLAARLRQNVSPRLAGLALDALLRREELEAGDRLALFADIRARMESLVRFPREAADGISDEQYVRNVADILFR